jgi:hypothetical protein
VSKGLARGYVGGKMPNVWSESDHHYVLHNFKTARTRHNAENFKYSTKDTDMSKFLLTFDNNYNNLLEDNTDDDKAHGDRLQKALEMTCASELKKVYPPIGKICINYWWSDKIGNFRIITIKSKRKAQRAWMRGTNDMARLSKEFKTNKKILARMIENSKERYWKNFCATLDRGGRTGLSCPEWLGERGRKAFAWIGSVT